MKEKDKPQVHGAATQQQRQIVCVCVCVYRHSLYQPFHEQEARVLLGADSVCGSVHCPKPLRLLLWSYLSIMLVVSLILVKTANMTPSPNQKAMSRLEPNSYSAMRSRRRALMRHTLQCAEEKSTCLASVPFDL